MTVDILIPMYNAEKTIERCVRSVAGQNVHEIILADDGSTDGTIATAEKLCSEIASVRLLRCEHGGVSQTRNRAVMESTADWVIFLDADDSLTDSAVRDLTRELDDNTDACCGRISRGTGVQSGDGSFVFFSDTHDLINYALADPTERLTIHGWIFRRSIIADNHVFFNDSLRMGEDSEWVLRCLKHCRCVRFADSVVYCYTISSGSTINSWKPGQTESYLKTLNAIESTDVGTEKNWPLFVLTNLLVILTHDTFHHANPSSLRAKLKDAAGLKDLPVFSKAFRLADLSRLEPAKRITLMCLKHNLLLPVYAAVRIRQTLNKRLEKKA